MLALCLSVCLNTYMALPQLDETTLTSQEERLVYAMQLLGDKTRFKLLKLLRSRQEMCVSELAGKLDISTSAVSQHFRSFEVLGMVNKTRYGQKICYNLKEDDQLVQDLLEIVSKES